MFLCAHDNSNNNNNISAAERERARVQPYLANDGQNVGLSIISSVRTDTQVNFLITWISLECGGETKNWI